MSKQPPPSNDPFELSPEEEKLGELLNEYYDRKQRDPELSEEQFLAEHPQWAEQLRVHLTGLKMIDKLRHSTSAVSYLQSLSPDQMLSDDDAGDDEPGDGPLPTIPGYELRKQIGRGGMGVVYKAIQQSTKRVVAIKILLDGAMASDAQRQRFEREIELAARLRHTNIIPIYDSGMAHGRMYCAMAYIYGRPLTAYLAESQLSLQQRIELFIKIASAVRYAHQRGVIHRDLKPSNIMIDGDREPHVFDFGLAKSGDAVDLQASITGHMIGTPAYMSPEQVEGDPGGIDVRTDVYSLGIILYEMLTGKLPYATDLPMAKVLENIAHAEPQNPRKYNREIDADLAAILLKALEKDKRERYQSTDLVIADLNRWLAGEPISVRPAGIVSMIRKHLWRQRVPVAVSLLILVLFFGFYKSKKDIKQLKQDNEQLELELSQGISTRLPDADMLESLQNIMLQIGTPEAADQIIKRAKSGDEIAIAMIQLSHLVTRKKNEPQDVSVGFNMYPPGAIPQPEKFKKDQPDQGDRDLKRLEQLLKVFLLQMAPIPQMGINTGQPSAQGRPQKAPSPAISDSEKPGDARNNSG